MNDCSLTFQSWLADFHGIAAALLHLDGRIVQASEGFRSALAGECEVNAAPCFAQPRFADLAALPTDDQGLIYAGPIAFGRSQSSRHAYSGKIFRHGDRLLVVAEMDYVAFGRISDELGRLRKEVEELRHLQSRRDKSLEHALGEIDTLRRQDTLTGLYNRRELDLRLDAEIARRDRYNIALSLILLDMDGFSAVNEAVGRELADEVLQHLGTLLRQRVREVDLVVRYGGQEFAILLPETSEMGALILADRLRAELETQVLPHLANPVTASFGVLGLHPKEKREEAYSRAWRALRHSKQYGGNCVTLAGREEGSDAIYESQEKSA